MLPAWSRSLPVLRTYGALRASEARLKEMKEELRRTREQRDRLQRGATHVIPYVKLKELVKTHAASYSSADPFPHVVFDDVMDPRLLDDVLEEFQGMDRAEWHSTNRETERKSSTEDFLRFGAATRALIAQMNSAPFLAFLEKLTGIRGLIADPHLRGGGLHEIRHGGLLGVHADFNYYPRLGLYRRLNLLLYLNREWKDEWEGHLELWDRAGTRRVRRIAPLYNRIVIFDTSNSSYHGHPTPLACPPEQSRKSIALYYYTVAAPEGDDTAPHSTVFLRTTDAAAPPAEAPASGTPRP